MKRFLSLVFGLFPACLFAGTNYVDTLVVTNLYVSTGNGNQVLQIATTNVFGVPPIYEPIFNVTSYQGANTYSTWFAWGTTGFIFDNNVNVIGDLAVYGNAFFSTNVTLTVTNWTTNAYFSSYATNWTGLAVSNQYNGSFVGDAAGLTNFSTEIPFALTNIFAPPGSLYFWADMSKPYLEVIASTGGVALHGLINKSSNGPQSTVIIITGHGYPEGITLDGCRKQGVMLVTNTTAISLFYHPPVSGTNEWTNAVVLPLW